MMRAFFGPALCLTGSLLVLCVPQAAVQSGSATPSAPLDTITPEWARFDAEAKTVDLKITAALTHVNGGWNFNGYTNGDLTITVPLGWRVEIEFVSRDGNVPHSVGIISGEPGSLPPSGEQAKVAFRGAYSVPFTQGTGANRPQDFGFNADKAGTFILYCGVPGHAAAGMWDYFVVSEGLAQPLVTVKKRAQG